jgi:hypothetical protein
MTSKYTIANTLADDLAASATVEALPLGEVQGATLVTLIQALKATTSVQSLRGLLQYEIDSLGSGDVYEVVRAGGHSGFDGK